VAVGLNSKNQAGAHRLAVKENRAGAANAMLAAHVRAGQPKIMPEKIAQ
jgi:hypothetical protein